MQGEFPEENTSAHIDPMSVANSFTTITQGLSSAKIDEPLAPRRPRVTRAIDPNRQMTSKKRLFADIEPDSASAQSQTEPLIDDNNAKRRRLLGSKKVEQLAELFAYTVPLDEPHDSTITSSSSSAVPAIIEAPRKGLTLGLFEQAELNNLSPIGFNAGQALDAGDCFFDAIAQALNSQLGTQHTVKSLRALSHQYVVNLDIQSQQNPQSEINWIAQRLGQSTSGVDFHQYMANIGYTTQDVQNGLGLNTQGVAIWGEQNIDGRIFCQTLNISIHVVEAQTINDDSGNSQTIFVHQLVTADNIRTVDVDDVNFNDPKIIHLAVARHHYVPILSPQFQQASVTDTSTVTSSSTSSIELNHFTEEYLQPGDENENLAQALEQAATDLGQLDSMQMVPGLSGKFKETNEPVLRA